VPYVGLSNRHSFPSLLGRFKRCHCGVISCAHINDEFSAPNSDRRRQASAIGGNFFATDISGAFLPGTISLTATDSFGAMSTQNIVNAGITSFLGFVCTGALTSLVVSAVQPVNLSAFPTVNNLILAQAAGPIPEPEIYAMMLAGLGLMALVARRRKHSTI
jgi:hypothetical protein